MVLFFTRYFARATANGGGGYADDGEWDAMEGDAKAAFATKLCALEVNSGLKKPEKLSAALRKVFTNVFLSKVITGMMREMVQLCGPTHLPRPSPVRPCRSSVGPP